MPSPLDALQVIIEAVIGLLVYYIAVRIGAMAALKSYEEYLRRQVTKHNGIYRAEHDQASCSAGKKEG